MAGEGGRGYRSHQTVAVIFVLFSLAHSSTCFYLQGLNNEVEQDTTLSEATVVEVRTGSILFNGKMLQSESGSASASATENDELLQTNPDSTEFLEQPLLLEDDMSKEAAWQHLNLSLHCSQKKMKFTAIGSGADDWQLAMGNGSPLPLQQVPDSCGYSVQQDALGLVLEVSYDGCYVIQEDGNYTLSLTWLETPVDLLCAVSVISTSSPPTTIPMFPAMPEKVLFRLQSMTRHKRQTSQFLPINDPRSPYYAYWYYLYYLNSLTAPTTASTTAAPTTTTTTKPPETTTTTTTTTKPSTEKPPPVIHPYNFYYPYYPYYSYYPFQQPIMSPTKPPTTTAKPTTSMPSTTMTTTPSTTKAPPKPVYPVYPQYPYLPPVLPPGKPLPEIPENSEIYYYPVIQHFYGKPPTMTTAKPSGPTTTTSKPTTPTTKPGQTVPTQKPTTPTTTKPTTASPAPTTQTAQTAIPDKYPGPISPFVPYQKDPFQLYVQYKSKKAGELPFDPEFMPQAAFKSGAEPQAHLHPGFNYWHPGPWFPESNDQGNPPSDWKNFQPEEN